MDNKDYPEIADDFAKTFATLKSLPCDVFLGAHGDYYGMLAKYEQLRTARTRIRSSIRMATRPMSI